MIGRRDGMSSLEGLHFLLCKGTRPHPGCGAVFYGNTRKLKFCPDCAALDKQSSFVFVERRQLRKVFEDALEEGAL